MEDIQAKELLYLFWKKKGILIAALVFGLVIGLSYQYFLVTPLYKSSTSLVLVKDQDVTTSSNSNNNDDTINQNDVTLNQKLIKTYSEIIKSNSVAKEVMTSLKLNITEEQFKSAITVNAKENTEVLFISVTNEDPTLAAKIANSLSAVFTRKITEMYKINNVYVVDAAEVPTSAFNMTYLKTGALGGLVCFVATAGVILALFIFKDTVNNKEDIETRVGLPVLAVIPKYKKDKED